MKRLVLLLLVSVMFAQGSGKILKVGYCQHDHLAALFLAIAQPEQTKTDASIYLKEIIPKEKYELVKNDVSIADVELILSSGGPDVPDLIEKGEYDLCLGGIQAVSIFRDQGAKVKLISPLHTKGDMLVVSPESENNKWYKFVKWIKKSNRQVKIGFINSMYFSVLIIEHALVDKGITFTRDSSDTEKKVLLVEMASERNLNTALQNGAIDGYVADSQICSVAEEKGIAKIIADLNNLPPGLWRDHPCCCVAATEKALISKKELVKEFLKLIILGTNYIVDDNGRAQKKVADWIGTSMQVEEKSMNTLEYSTKATEYWKDNFMTWINEMKKKGQINNKLKDASREKICSELIDLELLTEAFNELIDIGYMTWY